MNLFKRFYIYVTGYSYTNMGRLFLRLFIGIMLLQFGVRQWTNFPVAVESFPEVWGMSSSASLIVMIAIEIVCSAFIMIGFLTRVMIVPPFVAMVVAEYYLLHEVVDKASYMITWAQPGYLPIMFLGVFFFLLLVGPGKISVDYFLSLHFIHTEDKSENELEEV